MREAGSNLNFGPTSGIEPAYMRYLPNAITVLRILVTPLVLLLIVSDSATSLFWAFTVFVAASISDYVDGKLARRMNLSSRFGQFLDPLADKVLVIGTFSAIAYRHPEVVPWWAVAAIAARDVFVTLMRSRAEARGRSIRTSQAAKAKTVFQLTFLIATLFVLMLARLEGWPGELGRFIVGSTIPLAAVIGVVLVTVGTGVLYALRAEYSSETDTP